MTLFRLCFDKPCCKFLSILKNDEIESSKMRDLAILTIRYNGAICEEIERLVE